MALKVRVTIVLVYSLASVDPMSVGQQPQPWEQCNSPQCAEFTNKTGKEVYIKLLIGEPAGNDLTSVLQACTVRGQRGASVKNFYLRPGETGAISAGDFTAGRDRLATGQEMASCDKTRNNEEWISCMKNLEQAMAKYACGCWSFDRDVYGSPCPAPTNSQIKNMRQINRHNDIASYF